MRVNHNTKMSRFTALEDWKEAEEFPTPYPLCLTLMHAGSVLGMRIITTHSGDRGAPQRVIQPPYFRRLQRCKSTSSHVSREAFSTSSLPLANFLRCWPEPWSTSTCSYTAAHVATFAIHSLIHPDFLEHKGLHAVDLINSLEVRGK